MTAFLPDLTHWGGEEGKKRSDWLVGGERERERREGGGSEINERGKMGGGGV